MKTVQKIKKKKKNQEYKILLYWPSLMDFIPIVKTYRNTCYKKYLKREKLRFKCTAKNDRKCEFFFSYLIYRIPAKKNRSKTE